MLDSLI